MSAKKVTQKEHIKESTVELLTRAAAQAEQDIASGVDPKTAFLKAATTYNLTPEQTKLIVRGWNITNFDDHFRSAKLASQRASDIPVLHFDELAPTLTKMANDPLNLDSLTKQASPNQIWPGYLEPPKFTTPLPKHLKDSIQAEITSLKYEDLNHQIHAFTKQSSQEQYQLQEFCKKAADAFTALCTEFYTKKAQLIRILETSQVPDDILEANLRVTDKLAYKLLQSLKPQYSTKRAAIVHPIYTYDASKEPYRSLHECSKLMKEINDKAILLNSLKQHYYYGKDLEKKASIRQEQAFESIELFPLSGGSYRSVHKHIKSGGVIFTEEDIQNFFPQTSSRYESPSLEDEENPSSNTPTSGTLKKSDTIKPPKHLVFSNNVEVIDEDIESSENYKVAMDIPVYGKDNPEDIEKPSYGTSSSNEAQEDKASPFDPFVTTVLPPTYPEGFNFPTSPQGKGNKGPNDKSNKNKGPKDKSNKNKGPNQKSDTDPNQKNPPQKPNNQKQPDTDPNQNKPPRKPTNDLEKIKEELTKLKQQLEEYKGNKPPEDKSSGEKKIPLGDVVWEQIRDLMACQESKSKEKYSPEAIKQELFKNFPEEEIKSINFHIDQFSVALSAILNDPILADYPADEVIEAVGAIGQFAPNLLDVPQMMAIVVRKYLDQNKLLDIQDIVNLIRLGVKTSEKVI